jgi:hypothetical protein
MIHGPVKDHWGFVGTAARSTSYCTVQIMVKIVKILLARINMFVFNWLTLDGRGVNVKCIMYYYQRNLNERLKLVTLLLTLALMFPNPDTD